MGKDTKISWATHTFNPFRGCSKISEGCRNCYAEAFSGRNPSVLGVWGPNGTRVVAAEAAWKEPLKWNRAAKEAGERHRVFCASLADVFEDWQGPMIDSGGQPINDADGWYSPLVERRPLTMQDVRRRLFELIDSTPNLDWLLVTKRPENITRMMPAKFEYDHAASCELAASVETPVVRHNVWIGTSVENQQAADERIPHLLKVPARVRFLSCEPLLGPVNLMQWLQAEECEFCGPDFVHVDVEESYTIVATGETRTGVQTYCDECPQRDPESGSTVNSVDSPIHWVIVGGESGSNARPMFPDWARSIRDQCRQASGVAFHFKQWGEWQIGGSNCVAVGTDGKLCDTHGGQLICTHPDRGHMHTLMSRVGKENAGRILDGRTWDEVPS